MPRDDQLAAIAPTAPETAATVRKLRPVALRELALEVRSKNAVDTSAVASGGVRKPSSPFVTQRKSGK